MFYNSPTHDARICNDPDNKWYIYILTLCEFEIIPGKKEFDYKIQHKCFPGNSASSFHLKIPLNTIITFVDNTKYVMTECEGIQRLAEDSWTKRFLRSFTETIICHRCGKETEPASRCQICGNILDEGGEI